VFRSVEVQDTAQHWRLHLRSEEEPHDCVEEARLHVARKQGSQSQNKRKQTKPHLDCRGCARGCCRAGTAQSASPAQTRSLRCEGSAARRPG
jgi:hypothetical protein